MLLCCSTFASLDEKSLVASSHFHSSISSISSAKESYNHSSQVRFNPASMISLDTSLCRMHLSACSNNSCVSIAIGSVLSLPACVFGKIKRAFAVDPASARRSCRVVSFYVVQFAFRPLNECRSEAEDSHTFACQ